MISRFTITDLEGFLDEALPPEMMASIEDALRDDPQLAERLGEVIGRRDAGVHTVGAIWRRHRLSCPSRQELGSYLLGVLDNDLAGYIQFHLEVVHCRFCAANLQDLTMQQASSEQPSTATRRSKYFQSSAGYLSSHDS